MPSPTAALTRGAAHPTRALARLAVSLTLAAACSMPAIALTSAERERDHDTATVAAAAAEEGASTAPLERFVRETESFRADFEQTLYDADSEPLQSARGTVVLERPGRFVWDYTDGIEQTIVADGTRVWLYDRELEQVTVNALDERVGGTPLALLTGATPLEASYTVAALGASDGIAWFELLPKGEGGDFEALYVGLDDAGLAAMELRDAFGQATQIRFTAFEAGIDVDDATFVFEVPEGVDVIGLDR